jgi:hypothetical protein
VTEDADEIKEKEPSIKSHKKSFSYTSDFQYHHHKFVPKKAAYYATRKEFNEYKRAFFEQPVD